MLDLQRCPTHDLRSSFMMEICNISGNIETTKKADHTNCTSSREGIVLARGRVFFITVANILHIQLCGQKMLQIISKIKDDI